MYFFFFFFFKEYHNNRFFALVENDFPYQVALPELNTLGIHDFEGKLQHPFTAHPVIKKFFFFNFFFFNFFL